MTEKLKSEHKAKAAKTLGWFKIVNPWKTSL